MMKKKILFSISLILYCIFLLPFFEWDIKVKAVILLLIIQILWIGRVFPLAFSSILLMIMLSFHFFSFEETMSYFGSGIIWLLFSTFIISHAFIKTGLASRIALKMLRLSSGSGKRLIFISFLITFVLSVLIPSNVGKGSLIASVLNSIISNLKKINPVSNLSKSLFIGLTYVVAISGSFVATGASSTIYAYGLFSQITDQMNYLNWILFFGPPIFLFIFLLWLLFLLVYPPEAIEKNVVLNLIDEKVEELGKITMDEIKVLCIIGLAVTLWMTEGIHHFSVPLIALFSASLTVIPVIGIWNWETARKKVDWDMILFFAGTLMVAKMLIETGTVDWIANVIVLQFVDYSPILLLIFIIIATALIRIVFVNVLGFLTIMIPIAITVGDNVNSFTSLELAMAVFLTGVPGFLLITQSPVHLISYSYGHFNEKDLFLFGVFAAVIWLLIVFGSVLFYWNVVITIH